MDTLSRLSRAKSYFRDYAGKPGANVELAEEQIAVTQKLFDREERIREKRRKREERRRRKEENG